ncbi:MAG: glycosyltransferase family 2 protein [Ignisphaera sp.]|uniref:Glycosyltransferase family 2 protein n=1 Tax=Ignisphaera aggregans TaxID=334771 RepID=A0A7J3MWG3_9CREN
MSLSIVIPTFNERENIDILVREIREKVVLTHYDMVMVDDNSPDGTWAIALENLKNNDVVIRRINMKGLSSAVIDGIIFSLTEYVVVMDADLQHPPEVINDIIRKLKEGHYDLIAASRYIPGGGVKGWSKSRLVISKGATLIAKLLLPNVRTLSDPMSGFFMVKRDIVDRNRDKLNPMGFKILLEIVERCYPKKVAEVPYTFRARVYGKSKLGMKTIANFLIHVLRLSNWRPVKFGLVGLSGTFINLVTLWLLGLVSHVVVEQLFVLGSIIAIEVSTLWNFFLHEIWTFRDRRTGSMMKRISLFHVAVLPGVAAQYISAISIKYGLALNPIISQTIGIVIGFPVNYIFSELGIWKSYR